MPKRYIGENLRTIKDVIDYANDAAQPAVLLTLDFRKAFDSLNWEFIFRALREFGFGDTFIEGIRATFQNIQSCTTNSGLTSNYFSPRRGVRQGCCVAPYLFVAAMEILSIQIRQNPHIKGISVGEGSVRITLFADDLTAFVPDIKAAEALLGTVEEFGSFSGLLINRDKSQILPVGPGQLPLLDTGGRKSQNPRFVVFFHSQPTEHYEWNYKDTLARMRCSICNSWRNRNLYRHHFPYGLHAAIRSFQLNLTCKSST